MSFAVGVLLAAGSSKRMGRPKLALRLGEMTLVERSVRSLARAGLSLVRVVVSSSAGAPQFRAGEEIEVVLNEDADTGIASSIRAGVSALPARATSIVIALADMPFVESETIRELVERRESEGAKAAYPVFRGRRGNPVVWDASLASELLSLEGDRGAKSLLDRLGHEAIGVPVDDGGVCEDIDTPEDYDRARSR